MRPPLLSVRRRPVAVANWKMYLSATASLRAAESIRTLGARFASSMDLIICPSFPVLSDVRRLLERSRVRLGAQDVHEEARGPYTGDVSVEHLRHLVRYVIVGHSERRRFHHETDEQVARKAHSVVRAGLFPIVCVGETSEEHAAGVTIERVRAQVRAVFGVLPVLDIPRLLFAYEPVWAIAAGLGAPASQPEPQEVAEVAGLIRKLAAEHAAPRYAERLRVLYGGSVTAETVRSFVSEPGVDGVLVGSASTKPVEFVTIAKTVLHAVRPSS